MSVIQQIVALQKIDSQLQDIAELLGDLPGKVEALKNEESALIKSVEDGKVRIKELDLELHKFDGQMTDIKGKIEKYKDQLFLVTTNKQYDALQHEIDYLKGELDEMETKSLEFTEEKESLEERLKFEEENLESLRLDLVGRREKLEILMNESSEEKAKLEFQRDKKRGGIDGATLTRYDRIHVARKGLSVVHVVGSACSGCGAFVPPQIVSEVRAGKGPHTCDSCSRFLYWESP
ncbi:MAG: C4-type zinc ribbon domain-containing protein [Candidatus Marinimicrobia bacterium]|nr:C4-type zinc ribbon domain-containing protein [Candidatus Neomarinimicrobiota bacterium]